MNKIFNIKNNNDFEKKAIDIFKYQAEHNKVYKKYLKHLKVDVNKINKLDEIIYLPIILFKSHQVKIKKEYEIIFESSGTTSNEKSQNYIHKLSLYNHTLIQNFEYLY